jgi:hypothetical protein
VAEPEGRFEGLTFESTDRPDPSMTSFEAFKVNGLQSGQMFSLGSVRAVYELLSKSFDGDCTGALEFDRAQIRRASGCAVTDSFTAEIEDWDGALGDTELCEIDAWAEAREGDLELWTAALDDSACGGDGSGVIAFVHDRGAQIVAGIFVEWWE